METPTPSDPWPLEIGAPSPAQREAALELAWTHLSRADRRAQMDKLLAQAPAAPELLAGLLVAARNKVVVGAIWAQLQAGRFAFMTLPQVASGEPATTNDRLLSAEVDLLARHDIRLAQAMLETDSGNDYARLIAVGFEHFADLLYMVCLDRSFPAQPPETELQFEAYSAANQERFERVIRSTYEGTRDCPRLNGVREMDDILNGYRATGSFGAERWLLIRHGESDVGCVLLAEHPALRCWELVYMGLVPEARGHGWGFVAVRQAQFLAGRARASRLVLAVDAENEPAVRTYAAAGFTAWDRRSVLLRIFGGG